MICTLHSVCDQNDDMKGYRMGRMCSTPGEDAFEIVVGREETMCETQAWLKVWRLTLSQLSQDSEDCGRLGKIYAVCVYVSPTAPLYT
jgi:hypothetical protein